MGQLQIHQIGKVLSHSFSDIHSNHLKKLLRLLLNFLGTKVMNEVNQRVTTSVTLISTFIGASPFFLGFFVKSYLKEKRLSFNLRILHKILYITKKGSLLNNKLIEAKGQSAERFILKEMDNLERELKNLEEDLKSVESEIECWKNYVFNVEVIKDSFRYFSRIFPQLSPQENKEPPQSSYKRGYLLQ